MPTQLHNRTKRMPQGDAVTLQTSEETPLAWFRQGHAELLAEIERRFASTYPKPPSATDLLSDLPRNAAHHKHLLSASELPLSAFESGHALEMLCYLSLQSLPRHSRVYSTMHLGGEWHDDIELRSVHHAMLEHEPSLLFGTQAVSRTESTMDISRAMDVNSLHLQDNDSVASVDDHAGMSMAQRILKAAKQACADCSTEKTSCSAPTATSDSHGIQCCHQGASNDASSSSGAGAAAKTSEQAEEGSHGMIGAGSPQRAVRFGEVEVETAANACSGIGHGSILSPRNAHQESPNRTSRRIPPSSSRSGKPPSRMTKAELWAERLAEAEAMKQEKAERRRAELERKSKGRSRASGTGDELGMWIGRIGRWVVGLGRAENEMEEDGLEGAQGGWIYLDDFDREQGPFSTARMRAWMKRGYLTNERLGRHAKGDTVKPLGQWPELDVLAIQQRARRRWHKASHMVSMATRAHKRAIGSSTGHLVDLGRAAQQRCAAALAQHALPCKRLIDE